MCVAGIRATVRDEHRLGVSNEFDIVNNIPDIFHEIIFVTIEECQHYVERCAMDNLCIQQN